MKGRGFLVAAVKSGSGKTTITCAILEALKQRGLNLSAFKCGPDYIDPMFHKRVIGVESRNLDTFFTDEEQTREVFKYGQQEDTISVVEGVMGLFDGLGGVREEGSAYHLARTLDLPIVLILDAHGMGRTMIPVIAGILQYDVDKRIAGVILNRTSRGYYDTIAPVIEEELKLTVLGFFPKLKDINLESRHLGLKLPDEVADLRKQVKLAADVLNENINVDKLIEIAGQGGLEWENIPEENSSQPNEATKKRVAIAMDEAFCFYYEDNLGLLRKAGVKLVPFSPVHDKNLPENIDGLILGGGYPELVAKELSDNKDMIADIKGFINSGKASIAECGGFMYLHEAIIDENGNEYSLVGAVPGKCRYTGKLVRFGYVEIEEMQVSQNEEGEPKSKEATWLAGGTIKAHEFHYYDSDSNGRDCVATKPTTGKNWECIHADKTRFWGYPHLYYPSNKNFVANFIKQL